MSFPFIAPVMTKRGIVYALFRSEIEVRITHALLMLYGPL